MQKLRHFMGRGQCAHARRFAQHVCDFVRQAPNAERIRCVMERRHGEQRARARANERTNGGNARRDGVLVVGVVVVCGSCEKLVFYVVDIYMSGVS